MYIWLNACNDINNKPNVCKKKKKTERSYLWVATLAESIWHPLNRSDKQNYDNRQFLQTKQIESKK